MAEEATHPDQYTLGRLYREMFDAHEKSGPNVGYDYAAIMASLKFIEALNQCPPDLTLRNIILNPTARHERNMAVEWLERRLVRALSQLRRSDLLHILARGCEKHPAYRAKQRPRTKCEECALIYATKEQYTRWPYDVDASRKVVLDILHGHQHAAELRWNRRCEHENLSDEAEALAQKILEARATRFERSKEEVAVEPDGSADPA